MPVLDKLRAEFIDLIDWLDPTTDTMVYRFPRYDNEIKNGAKLIVRESQAAIFISEGQFADFFYAGTYTLETRNLPILAKLKGWKYGFESPFKAEVYFISLKQFTDRKWGTKQPIIIRDPEFGPVRLRAFGAYSVRVKTPDVFLKEIVGTNPQFTTEGITEWLRDLIVTRFADLVGAQKIPLLDLAANYNEMGGFITEKLQPEFEEVGLDVTKILIESISVPEEVERALDKRSSMGIIGNLQAFTQYQTAAAIEAAASNSGASGGSAASGMGFGVGLAMAGQIGQTMTGPTPSAPPPLPDQARILYYVAISGQQLGPYSQTDLGSMARSGQLTTETHVWKQGMAQWTPAGQVPELQQIFTAPPLL